MTFMWGAAHSQERRGPCLITNARRDGYFAASLRPPPLPRGRACDCRDRRRGWGRGDEHRGEGSRSLPGAATIPPREESSDSPEGRDSSRVPSRSLPCIGVPARGSGRDHPWDGSRSLPRMGGVHPGSGRGCPWDGSRFPPTDGRCPSREWSWLPVGWIAMPPMHKGCPSHGGPRLLPRARTTAPGSGHGCPWERSRPLPGARAIPPGRDRDPP